MSQFPTLAEANISASNSAFVDELFGDDGYADDEASLIRPPVTKFVDCLLANTWNRHRKWIKSDKAKLDRQRKTVDTLWTGRFQSILPHVVLTLLLTRHFQWTGYGQKITALCRATRDAHGETFRLH